MRVQLGDFSFHGGELPGPTGFTISSQSGWTGGAGSRRDAAARPGGHGSFRTASYRPDRMFVFGGTYHGSSLDEVQHVNDALTGLEGHSLRVVVAWGSTLWSQVEVQRVRFDPVGWKAEAAYQLELWMPDPFKYGETRRYESSGSNTDAWHRGNTGAVPKFRVAGFSAGYSLFRPGGGTFRVAARTPGTVDEIDFATGQVRRDGVLVTGGVGVGDLWTVPGGGTTAWRVEGVGTGSGSTGTAAMYLHDTFI